MRQIPKTVSSYKKTGIFNSESVPDGLLRSHRTSAGVWGKIVLLHGKLIYCIEESGESIELTPLTHGVIEPEVFHHVKPGKKVSFYVEFFR